MYIAKININLHLFDTYSNYFILYVKILHLKKHDVIKYDA